MLRSFAGGRLFGSRTGTAQPCVLALHGWARTHRDFDRVITAPAPLDALALDLPGFGASPAPPEAWGAAEYADCLADLLDEMAVPVVVVGHSFGGRVAVHLAASRPRSVRGLVLTGVPLLRVGPPRHPAPAFRVVRALHRHGLVGDARMEAARRRYGSSTYRNAEGVMRQVLVRAVGESYEPQLEALECPVHLVWGEADTTAPMAVAEKARAQLAARRGAPVELLGLPGVGHMLPTEAPGPLREVVDRVLAATGAHST